MPLIFIGAISPDAILHDSPTMSLAGDLYSQEFYGELWRVLRRGGKLFHYIRDSESKFGANMTRGVIARLRAAGFGRVERKSHGFGVVCRNDVSIFFVTIRCEPEGLDIHPNVSTIYSAFALFLLHLFVNPNHQRLRHFLRRRVYRVTIGKYK